MTEYYLAAERLGSDIDFLIFHVKEMAEKVRNEWHTMDIEEKEKLKFLVYSSFVEREREGILSRLKWKLIYTKKKLKHGKKYDDFLEAVSEFAEAILDKIESESPDYNKDVRRAIEVALQGGERLEGALSERYTKILGD